MGCEGSFESGWAASINPWPSTTQNKSINKKKEKKKKKILHRHVENGAKQYITLLNPQPYPPSWIMILQGEEVSFGLDFIGPKENITPTLVQEKINKVLRIA